MVKIFSPIAIHAPLGDHGSLSYVGASLVRAFDELGTNPIAIPARGYIASDCHPSVPRGIDRYRQLRRRHHVPVVDRVLRYAFLNDPWPVRAREKHALLFWDSDQLSPEMVKCLAGYDRIYGISQFVADVMAEGTGREVGVIHHGIWPELCPYVPPPTDGPFTFLHLGQVDRRKATDLLMRAFVAAFPTGKEDVRLVVKTQVSQVPTAVAWWVEHGRSDPRIVIDGSHATRRELSGWFQRAHVVVLPSRCEGFGLVGLEALAHGRMLICTSWSGPAEYAHPSDCVLLPRRRKVSAECYPGSSWEIDEEALTSELQVAERDFRAVTLRGRRARERVLSAWTWSGRVDIGCRNDARACADGGE